MGRVTQAAGSSACNPTARWPQTPQPRLPLDRRSSDGFDAGPGLCEGSKEKSV